MSSVVRLNPEPFTLEIRHGAIDALGRVLAERGYATDADLAVVVGPGLGQQVADQVSASLGRVTVLASDGGALENAERLGEAIKRGRHEAVIGIGRGRTLDTAKLAAGRAGIPVVVVATNLAHDGLASPVAVLESGGHRNSYAAPAPIAVVVDLDYVRKAPPSMIRAGVGDVISNLVAVADWELAHEVRVATLFILHLRGDDERAAQVDACLRRHGLPRVPRDLGLTEEQYAEAVLSAPSTRPDRFTILEHLDLDRPAAEKAVRSFVARYGERAPLRPASNG